MGRVLFMGQLHRVKDAFFAGEDLGAETSTVRAVDLPVHRLVSGKARHALHFGRDKTDVQWRMFQGGATREGRPVYTKNVRGKFKEFTQCDMHCGGDRCLVHDLPQSSFQDGLQDLFFTHVITGETSE